eukprot:Tbor_TRINITY_DN947_c0_g1::TRINITY_DN947_c0_g1_i1::g.21227::m.21227
MSSLLSTSTISGKKNKVNFRGKRSITSSTNGSTCDGMFGALARKKKGRSASASLYYGVDNTHSRRRKEGNDNYNDNKSVKSDDKEYTSEKKSQNLTSSDTTLVNNVDKVTTDSIGESVGLEATVSAVEDAIRGTNVISDKSLEITLQVLETLNTYPDLFTCPRFKSLRALVYPLTTGSHNHKIHMGKLASRVKLSSSTPASRIGPVVSNNSVECGIPSQITTTGGRVARISAALSAGRWAEACVTLTAMRESGERPKLGAVQRWVRDCDAMWEDADQVPLLTLDKILRLDPNQISNIPTDPLFLAKHSRGRVVQVREPWSCVGMRKQFVSVPPLLSGKEKDAVAAHFRVIGRENAADRNPPNEHDLAIYAAKPYSVVCLRSNTTIVTRRHEVPFVPGAFVLEDLLSLEESNRIVQAMEAVTYMPDKPMTDKKMKSVLAHNVVWCADDSFMAPLFDRCSHLLPQSIRGQTLTGINSRLRCYRYRTGAVYRQHVDGAWPRSGIDPDTDQYKYDVSNGKEYSRLTFLIYLNEGFEGGSTTFLTPAYEEGRLNAHAVEPRVGCCLVFPHGDDGCLVHEGSAIRKGTKYIIRTEVLYSR